MPLSAFFIELGTSLMNYLIKERVLDPIKDSYKTRYSNELGKIIDKTDIAFKKNYPEIVETGGKHPFFQDNSFLQILLQSTIVIKDKELDINEISKKLLENKNVLTPTKTQIENYLKLFYNNIKEDPELSKELKKLWITDNYKSEIFNISKVLSEEILTILGEIREAVTNQKNTFQAHIDKLVDTATENTNHSRPFYYRSGRVKFTMRKEWDDLVEFCKDENQMLWWAITGDGGSGKSRLAYEFARQMLDG